MAFDLSRRNLLRLAAGAAAAPRLYSFQQPPAAPVLETVQPFTGRSVVGLVQGEDRRKNVYQALTAVEDQILPALRRKKYVVIKPNIVSTVNQLASTHSDALNGILDFLEPRFKGPVVIAESSAGPTLEGFESFHYDRIVRERRSQRVSLVDLNAEAKYEVIPLLDANLHVTPCRLAARLLDPDAFQICAAVFKTHNVVVATLSVKNMTLGAPLHEAPGEAKKWNDKRKYHGGVRQTHYNMLVTAQKMAPFWGATVIDGYEGMEGNGPGNGLPVASRVALASTDFIAADRVAVEAMGIDPAWPGYLNFCGQCGIGQYDLKKIELRGNAKLAQVMKKYQLHRDIERELEWMGPMHEVPAKLG
ncbi:MAG: DUF362 domain-containing protein [Acidobacteria bacterium]|nr:DUF362 domain-containing protein [Acidobacteriota bacterium]